MAKMAGTGGAISKAVAHSKTSGISKFGRSQFERVARNPKKSALLGGAAIGTYGLMRGRRGNGTGRSVPGAQKGIRNY